jgi:hypothetical protein
MKIRPKFRIMRIIFPDQLSTSLPETINKIELIKALKSIKRKKPTCKRKETKNLNLPLGQRIP